MKSLKRCKTRKEDQIVPPTARSKCIGAFQIRKELPWNRAVLTSWGYFDQVPYRYKFYNCDCSKTKIIKLNHLYLYNIETGHIYTVFYFRSIYSQTFLYFYDLKRISKYESQKSQKLPVLSVSNFLFTIYPGWDLAQQCRGPGFDTTQGLSANNFRHPYLTDFFH